MSYARNNGEDSDVYVIRSDVLRDHMGEMVLTCIECSIEGNGEWFVCQTPHVMKLHLSLHVHNGDKVPERTFERLERERWTGEWPARAESL